MVERDMRLIGFPLFCVETDQVERRPLVATAVSSVVAVAAEADKQPLSASAAAIAVATPPPPPPRITAAATVTTTATAVPHHSSTLTAAAPAEVQLDQQLFRALSWCHCQCLIFAMCQERDRTLLNEVGLTPSDAPADVAAIADAKQVW